MSNGKHLLSELQEFNKFVAEVHEQFKTTVAAQGGDWIGAIADVLVRHGYMVISNDAYQTLEEMEAKL